jgi:hypothetical protein
MSQEKNQLFKEFEKEIWLFLDKDLSESRMIFWKQKLEEIPELNSCLEDYLAISKLYDESEVVDLDNDKFNFMIDTALSKNSYLNKIRSYLSRLLTSESEFAFGKIAFASLLIVGAIAVSIISNQPSPISNMTNTINAELLDWDADFVDRQIGKVGNLLKVTKDEEYRKYYKYKLTAVSVDKNINLINSNIETLKQEINNKEL